MLTENMINNITFSVRMISYTLYMLITPKNTCDNYTGLLLRYVYIEFEYFRVAVINRR